MLPSINRKSREPWDEKSDGLEVPIQQAIWIVPIDDSHCEEMRLTGIRNRRNRKGTMGATWRKPGARAQTL